jgi:hypothetical protein
MTKPLDNEIAKNSLAAENAEAEKQARFRRFVLPFLYGLASANFIALIQFISLVKVDWHVKPAEQIAPLFGLCGMVLMSVSIPALIMYAVYSEAVGARKRDTRKLSVEPSATVLTLGIVGITFTLAAFQPVVGIVFFTATGAMLTWVTKSLSRSN